MAADDRRDAQDASTLDASAGLRIALTPAVPSRRSVTLWRLRIGGVVLSAVIVVAGAPVGMVFVVALVMAVLVMAGGSAMARLELRAHRLRTERRK